MHKISWKRICSVLLIAVMALSVLFAAAPQQAEAASGYKKIPYGITTKIGSYYFKYDGGKLLYSKKKNSGYKTAGFPGTTTNAFSNGSEVLAVEYRDEDFARLSRFTIASGKTKALQKLPFGSYHDTAPGWAISTIYGNAVFLTRGSFEEWSYKTYLYNLSKKTFGLKKDNCRIYSRSGKYVLAMNEYQTDVSAHKKTLYKTTSGGKLSKVRKLGDFVAIAEFFDDYVFYVKCSDPSMKDFTICSCKKDGSDPKEYPTFKLADFFPPDFGLPDDFSLAVTELTKDYCKITCTGMGYTKSIKYYFKTGKVDFGK